MAAKIKGRVFDRKTQEPLIGATLSAVYELQDNNGVRVAHTDINGEFCFLLAGAREGGLRTALVKASYIGYVSLEVTESLDSKTPLQMPLVALHDHMDGR